MREVVCSNVCVSFGGLGRDCFLILWVTCIVFDSIFSVGDCVSQRESPPFHYCSVVVHIYHTIFTVHVAMSTVYMPLFLQKHTTCAPFALPLCETTKKKSLGTSNSHLRADIFLDGNWQPEHSLLRNNWFYIDLSAFSDKNIWENVCVRAKQKAPMKRNLPAWRYTQVYSL